VNIGTTTTVAVLCLLSLGQSPFGCVCVRLSAVETGSLSGRQMAELYWKVFDEFFAF
jgi:hypothetical protein